MTSLGKFALCFAVTLCLVQWTAARLELDKLLLQNIRFDLARNCGNMERDFDKEFANARYKLVKESAKLNEKALKANKLDGADCIEAARIQADLALTDRSQDLGGCLKDLCDTVEADFQANATLREVITFRNQFRNQLKGCRNKMRLEVRSIQNNFSMAGKRCLI